MDFTRSYRLIVQRDGKRVRLFTRNGHDWSDRFPLISEAALRNRNTSFVIDGEAVLLGVDGRSDFNGLHTRKYDDEVQFYAFDILVSDGEDPRLPLSMRKANLARLLARRTEGVFIAPFEQGGIGPDLFRHACLMGLEGLVSKHRDRPLSHWPVVTLDQGQELGEHAFSRVQDQFRVSRRRAAGAAPVCRRDRIPPLLIPYACAPVSFWRYGRPWRASPSADSLRIIWPRNYLSRARQKPGRAPSRKGAPSYANIVREGKAAWGRFKQGGGTGRTGKQSATRAAQGREIAVRYARPRRVGGPGYGPVFNSFFHSRLNP